MSYIKKTPTVLILKQLLFLRIGYILIPDYFS